MSALAKWTLGAGSLVSSKVLQFIFPTQPHELTSALSELIGTIGVSNVPQSAAANVEVGEITLPTSNVVDVSISAVAAR